MTISFPRQSARTRRFTLGAPRGFLVSPDGTRVVFLRSRHGTDPVTCLWTIDVGDASAGEERLIVDPRALDLPGEEDLPAEERARRERAREQAGGITSYATDADVTLAAFALSGRLFVTDLGTEVRALDAATPVFGPRPDPTGRRVAYVSGRALRVIDVAADGTDRALAEPEDDQVSYGLAEFVAAEEMRTHAGLLVVPGRRGGARRPRRRVARAALAHRRPGQSRPYARGGRLPGRWHAQRRRVAGRAGPRRRPPYGRLGPRDLSVPRRRPLGRRRHAARRADPRPEDHTDPFRRPGRPGRPPSYSEDTDPVWVEIVPGVPARTASGDLVWVSDDETSRRLLIGGAPVTPGGSAGAVGARRGRRHGPVHRLRRAHRDPRVGL